MSRREPTEVEVVMALIRLEDVRVLALRTALESGRLGRRSRTTAARFLAHSRARSAALRVGLEALGGGLDGPEPLDLAGETLVSELAAARDETALLRILAGLDRVAIDTCARALARLEVADLVSTVASVMGGHAQQLAALREALGEELV